MLRAASDQPKVDPVDASIPQPLVYLNHFIHLPNVHFASGQMEVIDVFDVACDIKGIMINQRLIKSSHQRKTMSHQFVMVHLC